MLSAGYPVLFTPKKMGNFSYILTINSWIVSQRKIGIYYFWLVKSKIGLGMHKSL